MACQSRLSSSVAKRGICLYCDVQRRGVRPVDNERDMAFQDLPIKRKVIAIMMLTSIIVLLLTAAAFTVYDLYSYRQSMAVNLSTTAAIVAENSSYSLLTTNAVGARQVLSALRSNPQVEASALYDRRGDLFAHYPSRKPVNEFPVLVGPVGHRFDGRHLVLYAPVMRESERVGTLFLQANVRSLYERLQYFGGIALLVMLGSVLVAWAIAQSLQQRITVPFSPWPKRPSVWQSEAITQRERPVAAGMSWAC